MNELSESPEFGGRMPPFSQESECSLLGGLLYFNEAYDAIFSVLHEDDFYRHDHRLIYRAICEIIADNKPADVITVAELLKARDQLEGCGGFAYLSELHASTTSIASMRSYAKIVHERAVMRAVLSASLKMQDIVYESKGKTAREVLDAAQEMLASVDERSKRGKTAFRKMSEALSDLFTEMDQPEEDSGVRTGLDDLDKILNKFRAGDLVVVGARPSVGKTSLGLNIAEHTALGTGKNVVMFSMEMTDVQLAIRALSGQSGIASGKFYERRLSASDWDRVSKVMPGLNSANFFIDQTGGLSIQQIKARARAQSRAVGGLSLLVVDYIQLSKAEDSRGANRAIEIGAVTSGLKGLAKELKCVIIALSQLNRDSTKDKTPSRPKISELRDSGSIEADADCILMLHRPYVTTQDESQKYFAEIIIGKQRTGGLGVVTVDYDPRLTKFYNVGESPGNRMGSAQNYAARRDENF